MRRVGFAGQNPGPEERPGEGNSWPEHEESPVPRVGHGRLPQPLFGMSYRLGKSAILCHSQTIWTEANQASVLPSNSSNTS